jgi:hypothetical protein
MGVDFSALMKLLPKLTSLTYLDLRDNPISAETKVASPIKYDALPVSR